MPESKTISCMEVKQATFLLKKNKTISRALEPPKASSEIYRGNDRDNNITSAQYKKLFISLTATHNVTTYWIIPSILLLKNENVSWRGFGGRARVQQYFMGSVSTKGCALCSINNKKGAALNQELQGQDIQRTTTYKITGWDITWTSSCIMCFLPQVNGFGGCLGAGWSG